MLLFLFIHTDSEKEKKNRLERSRLLKTETSHTQRKKNTADFMFERSDNGKSKGKRLARSVTQARLLLAFARQRLHGQINDRQFQLTCLH